MHAPVRKVSLKGLPWAELFTMQPEIDNEKIVFITHVRAVFFICFSRLTSHGDLHSQFRSPFLYFCILFCILKFQDCLFEYVYFDLYFKDRGIFNSWIGGQVFYAIVRIISDAFAIVWESWRFFINVRWIIKVVWSKKLCPHSNFFCMFNWIPVLMRQSSWNLFYSFFCLNIKEFFCMGFDFRDSFFEEQTADVWGVIKKSWEHGDADVRIN